MSTFFGKYRGKVANNVDPMMQGRIQVTCPAVLGDGQMSWAMPCSPYAGPSVGWFALPPVDANVWVEFEGGNPNYPIWVGGFWGLGEAPASPAIEQMTVLATEGIVLTLSNIPGGGGLTIEAKSPAVALPSTIKIDSQGIEISSGMGKLKLSATGVSINDGALEVM
jgi:hypothetical protein